MRELRSATSMVQMQKANPSVSRFSLRHVATIPSIRLRTQGACLTGLKLLGDAIEGEVKVQLTKSKMTMVLDEDPEEPRDHETEGAMLQSLHQTASTVMFQGNGVEEVLVTVVVVDVLARDASVRTETVKAREWPMGDLGRRPKNSTRKWTITGEPLPLPKLRTESRVWPPRPQRLLGPMTSI